MTDFDYETERLIQNLKKLNERLTSFNETLRALREEISNERTDGTKQDSD